MVGMLRYNAGKDTTKYKNTTTLFLFAFIMNVVKYLKNLYDTVIVRAIYPLYISYKVTIIGSTVRRSSPVLLYNTNIQYYDVAAARTSYGFVNIAVTNTHITPVRAKHHNTTHHGRLVGRS